MVSGGRRSWNPAENKGAATTTEDATAQTQTRQWGTSQRGEKYPEAGQCGVPQFPVL